MLAMRMSADQYEVDLPLSGRIRADVGPDGIPHMLDGRVLVEKGIIVDLEDPLVRIPIERAEISVDWDKDRRVLMAPFQIVSGGSRITLLAQFDAPSDGSSVWGLQISGGSAVLAVAPADPNALILNRVLLRMRIDPNKQRVDLEPSEVGNTDLGVALNGSLDFSGDDPRLTLGIAGTRMSVAALKRLWQLTLATKVRAWSINHVQAVPSSGWTSRQCAVVHAEVDRAPCDDGLLIRSWQRYQIRPVEGLPTSATDVNVHVPAAPP
jgi:hypothetical protein